MFDIELFTDYSDLLDRVEDEGGVVYNDISGEQLLAIAKTVTALGGVFIVRQGSERD